MKRLLATLLLLAAAAGALAQTLTLGSLPAAGTVGAAYSATISVTGGTGLYTFSVTAGSLPTPLVLDFNTGQLSGTPDTPGTYIFTVTVTDNAAATGSQTYAITIAPALSITTPSLPAGIVGVPYSTTLAASGGTAPLIWVLAVGSGPLPPGLSLSPGGDISGDPTTAGNYPVTIEVVDGVGATASQNYGLVIAPPPPVITTTSLPNGTVGVAYGATVAATSGTPPYTWSAPSLPPGLTIDPGTGVISGTPTTAGLHTATVTVTDFASLTDSKSYNVTIAPPLIITTTSLPNGTVGIAYSATVAATGGTPPYTWGATSLPPGLTINPGTGVISGTPTTAGSPTVTVTVTDFASVTDSKNYNVTIAPALIITTTSLPNGTVGVAYSATVAATGGTPPYAWSASSLPQGLTINPSTGVISGTPTTAGSSTVTVTVTDSASVTDSKNYNVTIAPPALAITTTSLPNGTVGVAYSATVTATGGTPPYTWSATSLPAGLSINPSSGLISGTPTTAGTRTVTVTVTDSATVTASNNFQVTIAPPSLVITTSSLPAGTVSATYSASLSASGGTPPYTWSLASGPLPPGLTLSSAGLISGMPIAFGTFSFTVRVADSAGASTTGALSIIVARPLTLTGTLPAGVAGSSYSQTLMASNGTPPYVFAISVGALPPGLSLNSSTGAITGVPTTAGSYTFAAQVTDSAGISATQSFTISIARPLAIATTSLPSAGIGAQYNQTLSASGGLPPYSWSVSSGRLPPGLTLDFASGVISGPATTEGTYTFTVSVSDSGGNVAAQGFSIAVTSGLTITSTSPLPPGAVGTAYSQALAAISGALPYTWTVTAGSLPPGITLTASTGVLSGTPTTSGKYTFTVRVADASSTTASAAFSLTIVTALSITTTSLPGGSVGASYSATLAAVAGTSPYIWSVTVGSLPQGLSLDAASGAISGKPGVEGTYAFTVQVEDAVGHTATQALTLVIAPALSPGGGALPDGVAGQPYSQQLTVTGGTAPYTFALASGSSLPAGLTLSGSGLLSGAPSAAGSFQFTVQIADSAGATAAHAYTLAIKVAALPGVAIAGLPATAEPLQQPTASVSLASAYPIDLTGQLVLTFQPDAAVPADDAAIQFSSGGRTADFSIPAGATQAAFPGASIQLQTGSTAGTITLTVHLSAAGVDATPNPPPSVSARISRSAPVIRKLSVVRTATGFEVWITGYSSSRELTQASFQFTAAAGGNLQTSSATVPLGDPAKTWYQDASSANYGSQFTIVQPFTVSGNTNAVASVSVTLSNALGASAASSASF